MIKKIIKWLLITIILLLIIIAGLMYYVLGTNHGLKKLVSLGNQWTDYQIDATSIDGDLFSGSRWKQLQIKGNGLESSIANLIIDWEVSPFAENQLKINQLVADKVIVKLPDSKEKPATSDDSIFPIQLNDINLPINAIVEQMEIKDLVIQQKQQPDIQLNFLSLEGSVQENQVTLEQLSVEMPQLSYVGKGSINPSNNWPITLDSKIELKQLLEAHPQASLFIQSSIHGEIKQSVSVEAKTNGLADVNLKTNVSEILIKPMLKGDLALTNLTPKLLPESSKITLKMLFDAEFDQQLVSHFNGQINYDSPQTNAIQLEMDGMFADHKIQAKTRVHLLSAKQSVSSDVSFDLSSQQIHAMLTSPQLDFPINQQPDKTLPEASIKQFKGVISGDLSQYQIDVSSMAVIKALQALEIENSLEEKRGEIPIHLTAQGDAQSLSDLNLNLLINQQPLTVKGQVNWAKQLTYQIQVLSDVVDLGEQYPKLDNVDLSVEGIDHTIDLSGQLSVSGGSIPSSQIHVIVDGDYTKALSTQLTIDTLGGQISSHIYSELSPLKLSGNLNAKAINPQKIVPEITGDINTQIDFRASEQSGQWFADVTLKSLSGMLQKLPLKGKGLLAWDGKSQTLNFSKLDVFLAGNRIKANGQLSANTQSSQGIEATIDAKNLHRLFPELSGQVSGEIKVKGHLLKPQGSLYLNANQLRFQNHQLQSLKLKANLDLSSDLIDVDIKANQLLSNQKKIEALSVNAKGKLSNHQLAINIRSDMGDFSSKSTSKIDMDNLSWQGNFNQLNLAEKQIGKWQLANPANVFVSKNRVKIDDFCLKQKPTKLCVKGNLNQGNGLFDINLKQLNLSQFKSYLPPSLKTDLVISADANVKLSDYKPSVGGEIKTNPAHITFLTANGGELNTKIKQFNSLFAFKDNRLETQTKASLSDLGDIQLDAVLEDVNRPLLTAELGLNIPSITFLEKLLPQLNEVKGRAKGKIQVSGDWTKQLVTKGSIDFVDGQLNYPQYGTEVRNIQLSLFADKKNRIGFKGSAKSGQGKLQLRGAINPITQKGIVNIKGKDFSLANSQKLKIIMNPDIKINMGKKTAVTGRILIPSAFIVPEISQSKVVASDDVIILSKDKKIAKQSKNSTPVEINLAIDLGDDIKVSSADIETQLNGGIKVISLADQPIRATGVIEIETGDIRVYGQELTIERGRVIFGNGPIDNPSLDVRASREIDKEDVTVGVNILGQVSKPEFSLFSVPAMSDSSIFSYLIFGRPPSSDSFGSAALLQAAGTAGTNAIAGDIRSSTGLDVLDVSLSSFEAGKNFGKKLYLGLYRDFIEGLNQLLLKYKFSGRTTLDAGFSSEDISLDLIKKIETD